MKYQKQKGGSIMEAKLAKLGDYVKDKISGYKGIVVCVCSYLQGCDRAAVQAKVSKDNKKPDWLYFDVPQLKVIKKSVIKRGDVSVGGFKPDGAERP